MSQGAIQAKYMQLSFRLLKLHALYKLSRIFTTGKAIVFMVKNA